MNYYINNVRKALDVSPTCSIAALELQAGNSKSTPKGVFLLSMYDTRAVWTILARCGIMLLTMRYHLISLFPESTTSYLNESILSRAVTNKLISFHYYNPRDFVKPTKAQKNKNKPYLQVDDKPYGGGPGMVIKAEPIAKAIEKALKFVKKKKDFTKELIVFLSPSGEQFTNDSATKMAQKFSDIIFICGRYEGVDARVKKIFKMKDYSVGPFVTTGGELPAMIMIDSISRQIEGVLGKFSSREETRDASKDVYTRPETVEFGGKKFHVPKILLSGNHKNIEGWRGARKGGTDLGGVVNR